MPRRLHLLSPDDLRALAGQAYLSGELTESRRLEALATALEVISSLGRRMLGSRPECTFSIRRRHIGP